MVRRRAICARPTIAMCAASVSVTSAVLKGWLVAPAGVCIDSYSRRGRPCTRASEGVDLLHVRFTTVEEARCRAALLMASTWHVASRAGCTLFTVEQLQSMWCATLGCRCCCCCALLVVIGVFVSTSSREDRQGADAAFTLPSMWATRFGTFPSFPPPSTEFSSAVAVQNQAYDDEIGASGGRVMNVVCCVLCSCYVSCVVCCVGGGCAWICLSL
jgi:hypothetical protein